MRPAELQHRLVRQVLKAWDARPPEQRNARGLVVHWTWCGSAQQFLRMEPVR